MKHITILALGSRGDVQPFIALALQVQQAGYSVTIAAAADYAELVTQHAIAFQPLVGAIRDLIDLNQAAQFRVGAGNPVAALRSFVQQARPLLNALVQDCWQACVGCDAIIVSTMGVQIGAYLQYLLQIPCVAVHFHPYQPTNEVPAMFFPRLPRGVPLRRQYHRLSHSLFRTAMNYVLCVPLNRAFRHALGCEPVPYAAFDLALRQQTTLHAYSPTIAPAPADWHGHGNITGYWRLPVSRDWQPPAELKAFLAAGAPPVLISFGSMMFGDTGSALTHMMVEALDHSKQRGIIYRGWGDMADCSLPPSVLAIEAVPHEWLMPQVALVVHHGGAGVTAAALHAGSPAIIVPMLGDQHFWAQRVVELGAGITINFRDLTAMRLAAAINHVLHDEGFQYRAAELSVQLANENGTQRAIQIIDQLLQQPS